MKTHKQILVATLIAMSLMTTMTAQAFSWPWTKDSTSLASTGSRNEQYAVATDGKLGVEDQPSVSANALVAVSSPVGGVAKTIHRFYWVDVSGYNSEEAQTDANPFITADGSYVRDGIVASNMFPIGTALKIPSLYGDKIFTVHDRMNTRYQNNVDVWMASHADAVKLGRRTVQIEVIK